MYKQILNTQGAAEYLGISKAFLERDRWAGAKIPFIQLGTRTVRYRLSDLENYLESQLRHSTSDTGERS